MLRFILLTSLLFSFFFTQGKSRTLENFKHLSVEEGLTNNRVVSVFQDSLGFIWLATHGGIERYSGNRLKHYSLTEDTNSLQKDNLVNSMIYTPYYDVLCGTRNGNIYTYNREKDRFEQLKNIKSDNVFNITALYCNSKQGIWIGSGSGLFFWDTKNSQLTAIKGAEAGVNEIEGVNPGELIVGTIDGLRIVDIKSRRAKVVPLKIPNSELCFTADVLSICNLDSCCTVLGTRNSEIITVNHPSKEQMYVSKISKLRPGNKAFPILDVTKTPDNLLALALDGFGILICDTNYTMIDRYIADEDNPSSLSSNGVYDLFYCKDKIMWVATYGGGINIADPNQKNFQIIQHQPYVKNSLRSNFVKSVLKTSDKRLWIGTKEGISIQDSTTGRWSHHPAKKEEASNYHVMDMLEDHEGNIWVASYGSGLICINPKNMRSTLFSEAGENLLNLSTDHLYRVFKDSKNRIWTGGIWGETSIIDLKSNKNIKVNVSNMRAILENEGKVYIGTLFGLYMVDMNTFKVLRPRHSQLLNGRIIAMTKHPKEHKIFIGTESNGLLVWDLTADSIKEINESTGLPSNYVRSIVWDNSNNLWLGSTDGLIRISSFTNEIQHYTITDGLANTEFNENCVFCSNEGRLYWGGPKGLTYFLPEQITKSEVRPSPILSQIKLFGKELLVDENGPLTKSIDMLDGIELKHNQNSISLLFDAITFSYQQKIQFKWRMKGLEEQWNGPGKTREAIYSKLPPGNYTFQIKVSNDEGVWQDELKEFGINIKPPFWATSWAFMLYLLVLLGMIYSIFKFYNIILQEKHASEKQQFFISIAHDLRTPLSLIKLPIEKMVEEKTIDEKETQNLSLIKRNVDRLTNLVNQLLDFQKADLHKMKLVAAEQDLKAFIQERLDVFSPLSKEKRISVLFHCPDKEIQLWFDRGKMEKIMYNLLSNAFKYTRKGGHIELSLLNEEGQCKIIVKDTGEGIPPNQQNNIFKRYYRASNAINSQEVGSGVGLVLTKQLVELHHGSISFTSVLGEGSEFVVSIPNGKSHLKADEIFSEKESSQERSPIISMQVPEDDQLADGPRLLLVEDNVELLDSLSNELKLNYKVFCASNGEEGLRKAQEFMPDIIVSDVMMPVMNGHELCIQLKRSISTCHIPIVLLTALDSPDYKREGLEHGADAYLEKPFDLKLLKAQISNLIKNRQLLKTRFLEPSGSIKDASPTNADQSFLESIREHVITNIDNNDLSVENTARELGMSRPVLYRKIKAITDLSPQQFVMTIKLKEAARIMSKEHKNISETAYMIGFSDPKYFSQTFKKYFGKTPSQYLKEEIAGS